MLKNLKLYHIRVVIHILVKIISQDITNQEDIISLGLIRVEGTSKDTKEVITVSQDLLLLLIKIQMQDGVVKIINHHQILMLIITHTQTIPNSQ